MRRPLGVLAAAVSLAAIATPLSAAQAAAASETARCRVSVAQPQVSDTLKIETSAARRGCFNSALLRIRIMRAVPGKDPVVKSGATRKGRLTLALACAPGTYYATATDYRGRPVKSKAAKLTCTPGSGTPTPSPSTPTPSPSTTSPATPTPAPSSTAPSTGTVGTAEENEVVRLVNAERAKGGCSAVKHDPQLRAAAFGHSADMAAKGYFSHNSQDGRSFMDRIRAAGFTGGSGWAENIAKGQRTPAAVMQSWMNSSGHKANIMNCKYNLIGVGVAKDSSGTLYWTQDFAAR
ncbi:CAP domain-containing protein [Nonomuraea gerenzanensis]|uniref:CAP domain-containing protein n=1 Tax=Nonomuraea gerenzanensis TaxID=93944 RepID=UPI001CDA512D|nr:CAP domain-containing protein [Nonomuraea gerenzanensis]UBU10752.1 CAP domain-containing protein [Nonomuraea gerenzanensis]